MFATNPPNDAVAVFPESVTVNPFAVVYFVPFNVTMNGLESTARLGDNFRIALEPIKNPVTGDVETITVSHGTGFIFKSAECASAKEGSVAIDKMKFSYPNKAGFVARIHYGN